MNQLREQLHPAYDLVRNALAARKALSVLACTASLIVGAPEGATAATRHHPDQAPLEQAADSPDSLDTHSPLASFAKSSAKKPSVTFIGEAGVMGMRDEDFSKPNHNRTSYQELAYFYDIANNVVPDSPCEDKLNFILADPKEMVVKDNPEYPKGYTFTAEGLAYPATCIALINNTQHGYQLCDTMAHEAKHDAGYGHTQDPTDLMYLYGAPSYSYEPCTTKVLDSRKFSKPRLAKIAINRLLDRYVDDGLINCEQRTKNTPTVTCEIGSYDDKVEAFAFRYYKVKPIGNQTLNGQVRGEINRIPKPKADNWFMRANKPAMVVLLP